MRKMIATIGLAVALAQPFAARADETADKVAVAKSIVEKTILKTLDTGFHGAVEKAASQMPDDKASAFRKDADAEFNKQREVLLNGISKNYAEKFSLADLKHIVGIYDDPVYQKFQLNNSDPNSEINVLSQAAVTRLLNLITIAAAGGEQKGGAPGPMPMPSPASPPGAPPAPAK